MLSRAGASLTPSAVSYSKRHLSAGCGPVTWLSFFSHSTLPSSFCLSSSSLRADLGGVFRKLIYQGSASQAPVCRNQGSVLFKGI